ncbi:GntR family transcriptional regulator [Tardiphaga robiniae]|uniref:GntR family transcriptional regulator n=1 Tax=Tardiphaga robiniae TaxID=943830 RepID=A0A7G6U1F9_9BRAD|nr:GntR family transcriptional regulator [Tardiphaga robiniae]QND72841.1 GntR family transcriptional regulator [Tardiphaga robiniae]
MTRSPNLHISVDSADVSNGLSVPAAVAARLREAIFSGELAGGALLRQEEISQLFSVGRPPVREALTLLEAEGLVLSRPRRGFVVANLNLSEIEEIFEIRGMLEERAAYLAAQRRTLDDVTAMENLVRKMERTKIRNLDDAIAFSLLNRDFHDLIHGVSGRKIMAHVMLGLRNKVERFVRLGCMISGNLDAVNLDHSLILDAFRAGDAERMSALCKEHVRTTGERLIHALGQNAQMPNGEIS